VRHKIEFGVFLAALRFCCVFRPCHKHGQKCDYKHMHGMGSDRLTGLIAGPATLAASRKRNTSALIFACFGGVMLVGTPPASHAQSAKPMPLVIPESEVSEATRRQAEGPMRFILQIEQKEKTAAAAKDAKPAAAPAAVVAKPKPATPSPTPAIASTPAAAPTAKPVAETPAPTSPAAAEVAPAVLAAPAPAAAPVAKEIAPPTLLSMVEPDISLSSRRRLQGAQSATVRFNIAADGSVTDPEVLKTSNSVLRQPVLDAIKQWRYTPPGQVVSQTVELQLVDAE
jgi:TonB family protein